MRSFPLYAVSLIAVISGQSFADTDTELRLQQQLNTQQQNQGQSVIQKDTFLSAQAGTAQATSQANTQDLITALFIAINRKQTADIETLLARYRQSPFQERGMILFAEANIAFNQGNIAQAITLYQQLIKQDPDFIRGKLDLARLYYFDHQYSEAGQLFKSIRLNEQPNVMAKVNTFLTAIEQRQAWTGNLTLGSLYHSNLNQSPNKQKEWINEVPFVGQIKYTRSSPKAENGWGMNYEGSLSRYTHLKQHSGLIFKTFAYGHFYKNQAYYNEHQFISQFGYRYKNQSYQLDLLPVFEASYQYKKWFSTRTGLKVEFSASPSSNSFISLSTEYKNERYTQRDYKQYDGNLLSTIFTGAYALPEHWVVFGGLDYLMKNGMQYASDRYARQGVRFGIGKTLRSGMELTANASLRHTHYKKYTALLGAKRKDSEQYYQLSARLAQWQFQHIVPILHYTYTKRRSNVDWLYSYHSHEIGIKFEKQF